MKLPPGRELDALMAEKVMGIIQPASGNWIHLKREIKPYSIHIAAAWPIFEAIRKQDETAMLGLREVWLNQDMMGPREVIYGETAAHAICLAALKVFCGIEVEA